MPDRTDETPTLLARGAYTRKRDDKRIEGWEYGLAASGSVYKVMLRDPEKEPVKKSMISFLLDENKGQELMEEASEEFTQAIKTPRRFIPKVLTNGYRRELDKAAYLHVTNLTDKRTTRFELCADEHGEFFIRHAPESHSKSNSQFDADEINFISTMVPPPVLAEFVGKWENDHARGLRVIEKNGHENENGDASFNAPQHASARKGEFVRPRIRQQSPANGKRCH